MPTQSESDNRAVVWGTWDDDTTAMPEAAIAVTRYRGCLCLEQEDVSVNVAYRDIPELVKALRLAHRTGDPDNPTE